MYGQSFQNDPMWQYFAAVDTDRSGAIDQDELQRALTSAGLCGTWEPFCAETCRLLIAMLDRDLTGTLNFNEFREVWNVVNMWKNHFIQVDTDRSGMIEGYELQNVIRSMGYNLTAQSLDIIMKRYTLRRRG
eukprot:Sdes_comp19669_c0_seq3m11525